MTSPTWFTTPAEDPTIPTLPRVQIQVDAPAPRLTMEREPKVAMPDPHDVQEIEDQILRMAFGKAMRTIRRRTLIMTFLAGMGIGFVALAATIALLLIKGGV